MDLLGYSPLHFLCAVRGMLHALQGRLGLAKQDFERATQTSDISAHFARVFQVYLCEITGDYRAAMAHARSGAAGIQEWGTTQIAIAISERALGIAHTLNEEWSEALGSLDRSLEAGREIGTAVHFEPETMVWAARAWLGLGDFERAQRTLDEAAAAGERVGTELHLPHLHRMRARLQRANGLDRDAAEVSLRAALESSRRMGALFHEPLVHLEHAELARALEDEALRRREIEAARSVCAEMGAMARAQELARELNEG
jgi:tetratricopeptide (TPR) repeat protein